MAARLGVGVIGLGRRWRRYRRALAGLRARLEVRAVCDQVAWRAEEEAKRLGCAAAAGPVDLLERAGVDAVLLLDEQWFGLWPLERACQAGKPVLCSAGLAHEAHADGVRDRLRAGGLPVLMALPPLVAPATGRLRELLEGPLGPPRQVRAEWVLARTAPAPPHLGVPSTLLHSQAALGLTAACATLFQEEAPVSVWAAAAEAADFTTVVLEFAGGRVAQLTLWAGPAARSACRLGAEAEGGGAVAELPRCLRWHGPGGEHRERLPAWSAEQALLRRFVDGLRTGRPLWPGFEEAYRALAWLRAAGRSQAEGQRIVLGGVGDRPA
jgi:predicted dehydrogenase